MPLHAPTSPIRHGILRPIVLSTIILNLAVLAAFAGPRDNVPSRPWMNASLSPDERAAMVLKQMTLDEKISLLHGTGMQGLGPMSPLSVNSNGGAGYVVGVPRLGIPAIQMSDAASLPPCPPTSPVRPVGIRTPPTNTEP